MTPADSEGSDISNCPVCSRTGFTTHTQLATHIDTHFTRKSSIGELTLGIASYLVLFPLLSFHKKLDEFIQRFFVNSQVVSTVLNLMFTSILSWHLS